MNSYNKKLNKNMGANDNENHYQTLDEIDLGDIAQAIDGSKSNSDEEDEVYIAENSKSQTLRPKRFWFW
jgi:hypothetical protein